MKIMSNARTLIATIFSDEELIFIRRALQARRLKRELDDKSESYIKKSKEIEDKIDYELSIDRGNKCWRF